jgi:hypothetical protein
MIPVNMRGPIRLADETANHSSFIEVPVAPHEPESELQARIRHIFDSGQHWSVWYAFQLGRPIGGFGRRLFMSLARRGRARYVGSFSNLGSWAPAADGATAHAWVFCPLAIPAQPVGAGCVTYCGRLSVAIQLHPSLTRDPKIAEHCVDEWARELELA